MDQSKRTVFQFTSLDSLRVEIRQLLYLLQNHISEQKEVIIIYTIVKSVIYLLQKSYNSSSTAAQVYSTPFLDQVMSCISSPSLNVAATTYHFLNAWCHAYGYLKLMLWMHHCAVLGTYAHSPYHYHIYLTLCHPSRRQGQQNTGYCFIWGTDDPNTCFP